jgi:hypothetical protein
MTKESQQGTLTLCQVSEGLKTQPVRGTHPLSSKEQGTGQMAKERGPARGTHYLSSTE